MTQELHEGGAPLSEPQNGSSAPIEEKENVEEKIVSYADHKRAIDDLHKFKSRSVDRENENAELRDRLSKLEEKGLKEKEDYKGLYESSKLELDEERKKRVNQANYVSYNEKRRALMPELAKRNLAPEGHKLLDDLLDQSKLNDLHLETTSDGRFLVEGVSTFADKIQRDYPLLFRPHAAPSINTNTGSGDPPLNTVLTPDAVVAAEKKHGRNSQEYLNIRARYLEQRRN